MLACLLISVKKIEQSEHFFLLEQRQYCLKLKLFTRQTKSHVNKTISAPTPSLAPHCGSAKNWLQLGISCRASYLSASRTAVSHSGCHQFSSLPLLRITDVLAHPQKSHSSKHILLCFRGFSEISLGTQANVVS